mgnify:CR=1 FL=1
MSSAAILNAKLFCHFFILWLKRRVLFRTRAFSGFEAFKVTFRGHPAQKHQIFDTFLDGLHRFAAEIAFSIRPRALESKLPLNVKVTP